jgi:hypothetical protein
METALSARVTDFLDHVIMDFAIPGSTSVTVAAYEDGALPSDATWRVKAIAICATAGTS